MNFGKREQIVVGSISALGVIAVLHLVLFGPSAASFKFAKGQRDAMRQSVSEKRVVTNDSTITDYNGKNTFYIQRLKDGVTTLKLDEPDVFLVRKLEEIDPGPVKPPDKKEDKQKEIQTKESKDKAIPQTDLVMAEISRLRSLQLSKKVQLTFMGMGPANANPVTPAGMGGMGMGMNNANSQSSIYWKIPETLPANMQGSQLWDQLKQIANAKMILDKTPKGAVVVYTQAQNQYKAALQVLGLDLMHSYSLARFGTFAPFIQRLCYVDMIMKKAAESSTPVTVLPGEPINREKLLGYFDIDLDFTPVPALQEDKVYFLYEELRGLNFLIETAAQMKVKEITSLSLRGYAFFRFQPEPDAPDAYMPTAIEKFQDDETDDGRVWAENPNAVTSTDPALTGGVDPAMTGQQPGAGQTGAGAAVQIDPATGQPIDTSNLVTSGPPPSQPKKDIDLGLALPIRLTFVAPNNVGIEYLYEVMRQKPLSELHRLIMRSTSTQLPGLTVSRVDPTNTDIEFTATVLFVIKMFDIMDTLKKTIKDIADADAGKVPGAPGAPAAPAGAAPAPAGAAPAPARTPAG